MPLDNSTLTLIPGSVWVCYWQNYKDYDGSERVNKVCKINLNHQQRKKFFFYNIFLMIQMNYCCCWPTIKVNMWIWKKKFSTNAASYNAEASWRKVRWRTSIRKPEMHPGVPQIKWLWVFQIIFPELVTISHTPFLKNLERCLLCWSVLLLAAWLNMKCCVACSRTWLMSAYRSLGCLLILSSFLPEYFLQFIPSAHIWILLKTEGCNHRLSLDCWSVRRKLHLL